MRLSKPSAIKVLTTNKSFVTIWPFKLDVNNKEKYDAKLRNAYSETNPEDDTFALEFFGDVHFAAGVWLSSVLSACHGITEYVYKFSYDRKLNASKNMFGIQQKGACHGDNNGYLFNMSNLSKESPDDDDILFRSKMTKMWTNFAKSG